MERIRVTTRALDTEKMTALLTRHHVGRMAFSLHDRLSIVLANYLFSNGWIYDPMPSRVQLLRIHVDQMVGTEARTNARDSLPPP